jgi:hypothetical protein
MIPVIVISLQRSSARREAMRAQMDALRVPFTFLDAVDGNALAEDRLREVAPKPYVGQHGRSLSANEVGCALSHLEAARIAANADEDFTCVLEDDVRLDEEALALLRIGQLRELPPFDVLRLANSRVNPRLHLPLATVAGRRIVAPFMPGYNACGQIYSRDGAARVAKHLLPLRAPFDNEIYRDSRIPRLRVLEVRPAVAHVTDVPSTIQKWRMPPTRSSALRRKGFLFARYLRSVRNFVGAWGVGSIAALRSERRASAE